MVERTAHLFPDDATDVSSHESSGGDDAFEGWVGGDACAQLILAALRRFFAAADRTDRECMLAAVLCTTASLRRLLPLTDRALALPADFLKSSISRDVGPFVAAVQTELVRCLSETSLHPSSSSDNGKESKCEIADLFDGRLYLSLLAALTAGEPLPPSLLHDTTTLWKLLGCRGGEITLSAALSLSMKDEDRQVAREWIVAAAGIAVRSRPSTLNPTPYTLHPTP